MIRNLLFDLGGVIMDIRRENCVEAFRQLGMTDPDEFLGEYAQKGPFAKIENGEFSESQFHDAIRDIIGKPVSDSEIDIAFNKFLIGIPPHRLRELEQLHRHYKIYMLSNTNPIMWRMGIRENFAQLGHDVNYYFDGIVRSYKAGCMKPDPRIFRFVETTLGINPDETLFFDDSQKNVDAARALGFHALVVPPGAEFTKLMTDAGYAIDA